MKNLNGLRRVADEEDDERRDDQHQRQQTDGDCLRLPGIFQIVFHRRPLVFIYIKQSSRCIRLCHITKRRDGGRYCLTECRRATCPGGHEASQCTESCNRSSWWRSRCPRPSRRWRRSPVACCCDRTCKVAIRGQQQSNSSFTNNTCLSRHTKNWEPLPNTSLRTGCVQIANHR